MSLVLLIGGTVLAAFSIQESYTEENTLDEWDNLGSSTLEPRPSQGFSWTLEVQEGSFFELDVSASDTVRIRIGTPTYDIDTGEEVSFDALFDQVGTHIAQKVAIDTNDTCTVEIKNEETTPVSVWGNVLAKKMVTTYETSYPHTRLATPVVLIGLTSLTYGFFTKPKKKLSQGKVRQ